MSAPVLQPALPPPALRFMGETDDAFLSIGDHLAAEVLAALDGGADTSTAAVLDVGCGYGRLAYGLQRAGFQGTYRGFDILREHVAWLDAHFVPDTGARYGFDFLNVHNARYNPSGLPFETLALPYAERSVDCITTFSVFTHMYEDDIRLYLRRIGALLRDGGVWIATFFALPDGFTLDGQSPAMRYRMTQQISDDAFVHDPAEPLHVIAYRTSLLRALIAEQGLEVAAHRPGSWLGETAGGEFQDWFVLRRRAAVVAEPVAAPAVADAPAAPAPLAACVICGGRDFGPGPAGRMAPTGIAPYCRRCSALERHRVGRHLLQALPIGFLDWRRCLQFSPDPAPNPAWFRSHELSVYGSATSLDIQAIDRLDASYDFVTLSHVLECIPRDRTAFDELLRILTPRGILHLVLAGSQARAHTANYDESVDRYGTIHLYGRDVYRHFGCAERGLGMLVAEGADPVTGVRDVIHLFVRHLPDLALLRGWLSAWDPDIVIVDEAMP